MSNEVKLRDAHFAAEFVTGWKLQAQRLRREAYVFYYIFKHPRTRWYTKVLAACTAAYLVSPIQLIPNFIPVIGFLDDFVVLFLGAKLVWKMTPPTVLAECCELARAVEHRRHTIKTRLARLAVILTVASWLVGSFAATALLTIYVRH